MPYVIDIFCSANIQNLWKEKKCIVYDVSSNRDIIIIVIMKRWIDIKIPLQYETLQLLFFISPSLSLSLYTVNVWFFQFFF